MSKQDLANQSAAQETTVESQNSANSLEHRLLKLNVNEHTERKQNLTYLSWAWAWAEALRADPAASFRVHTFTTAQDGSSPVMQINDTGMVWVDVTLNGRTRTGFLPVMDHRNKPISEPDAFQVNTAIMRCMTKTLALFGLGLYIYAGEDLPEDQEEAKPAPKAVTEEVKTDPNLPVFAEGLIKFVDIATDEKSLRSYWKANQTQIDQLKQAHPDLFADVLARFKQAQAAFKEIANA